MPVSVRGWIFWSGFDADVFRIKLKGLSCSRTGRGLGVRTELMVAGFWFAPIGQRIEAFGV